MSKRIVSAFDKRDAPDSHRSNRGYVARYTANMGGWRTEHCAFRVRRAEFRHAGHRYVRSHAGQQHQRIRPWLRRIRRGFGVRPNSKRSYVLNR
jgi:hypothetical protein